MPFLINNFFLFIFFSKNFIEQKLIDIFLRILKKTLISFCGPTVTLMNLLKNILLEIKIFFFLQSLKIFLFILFLSINTKFALVSL